MGRSVRQSRRLRREDASRNAYAPLYEWGHQKRWDEELAHLG